MERVTAMLEKALPYIILILLILFTMVVISNFYGMYKAKKVDPSLRLALNPLGKVVMSIIYGSYFLILIYTIIVETQIIASTEFSGYDKFMLILESLNALAVVSLIAGMEFQDIFFIGDKNIFIGNRMYEIRRMRKMTFPKKHTIVFVYGQKEYNYSTRFVDIQKLKQKFVRK